MDSEKEAVAYGDNAPQHLESIKVKLDDRELHGFQKHIRHADADEALRAFEHGEVVELTPAAHKRLLRRVDMHIMPVCVGLLHFHLCFEKKGFNQQ
jgi:hypothetical protein